MLLGSLLPTALPTADQLAQIRIFRAVGLFLCRTDHQQADDFIVFAAAEGFAQRGSINPQAGNPHSSSDLTRSEERRVGKECRSRWSPYH